MINFDIKPKQVDYFIGIDTFDKDIASYCLVRRIDNCTEVILAKTMKNDNKFHKESKNIAKYFNAIECK